MVFIVRKINEVLETRYELSAFGVLIYFSDRFNTYTGRRGGLVVERRTPEQEVGGSILTQVAVLYP